MNENFTIDPKKFILGPFSVCPKCGAQEYGVLGVYSSHFVKRCRACWETNRIPLPPLKKKIIYLDQFAVSDIMKALNSRHASNKSGRVLPFWKVLFEKLDRLSKLQLIVCPKSAVHSRETQISEDYRNIKRILDQLSHGAEFRDFDWIQLNQIHENLTAWIEGIPYCDAMFVDNACAAYLREEPLKTVISKYGRVYSMNTKDAFLEYLEGIEAACEPEHMKILKEVYGPEVGQPYVSIFENEREDD